MKNFKNFIIKYKEALICFVCVALYFIVVYPIANLVGELFSNFKIDPILNVVLFEITLYVILLVCTVLLMRKEFVYGVKVLKEKKIGETLSELFIGFACVYGAMIVGGMITTLLGGEGNSQNQATIELIMTKPVGVFMIPILCIVGPVVEELVFRAALQGGLNKLKIPRLICVFVAGTLFGLIHVMDAGDFVQLPSYLLAGLAFGFLYYKSGNIYIPIGVHVMINSFSTWAIYYEMILELME